MQADIQVDFSAPEVSVKGSIWPLAKLSPQPARLLSGRDPAWQDALLKKAGTEEERERIRRQLAYIEEFAALAQAEKRAFGIPASITLAQGLLESGAGHSRLARENANHFGIKCFSKTCAKGHCSNFGDDHHKDFFRIYPSAAASYRAHSELLQGQRYRHLQQLHEEDYDGWAHGLKKAGYATDPRYAEKLIALIEQYRLYEYDH